MQITILKFGVLILRYTTNKILHSHDESIEYKIEGGGGTDFMANWEYMKEHGIEPQKFIMFTDGYTWDTWGDPDYCDTVFVVHEHHDKNIEAPWYNS